MGSGSSGTDNFHRQALRADEIGSTDQLAHRLLYSLDLVRSRAQADAMPFIADQAAKAQTLRHSSWASARAGAPGGTPQRPMPVSTSTTTLSGTFA